MGILEIVVELILELFFEIIFIFSKDKSVSPWIRYPLVALVCLIAFSILALFLSFSYYLIKVSVFWGLLLLAFTLWAVSKFYKEWRS